MISTFIANDPVESLHAGILIGLDRLHAFEPNAPLLGSTIDAGTDDLGAVVHAERFKDNGIELRFIQPGKHNQNAYIERFNTSFWEKYLMPICSIRCQRLMRPLRVG